MARMVRRARRCLRVLTVLVAVVAAMAAPLAVPNTQAQLLLPPPPPIGPLGGPGFGFPGWMGPMGAGLPFGPMGAGLPFGRMPAPAARADTQRRAAVTMEDNYFLPAEITIPVGTTVTWTNRGRGVHTSTSPGVWDTGRVSPGGTSAAIFAVAGNFDYLCTIHPEMRGTIVVQRMAEASTTPPATTTTTMGPSSTTTPGNPGALLRQLIDTWNRGELAAAMALFTDDATFSGAGTCLQAACNGREAIQREIQRAINAHARVLPGPVQVSGNSATRQFQVTADDIRAAGVERLIGLVSIDTRGDRITSVRVTLDPNDSQNTMVMQRMLAQGAMTTGAAAPASTGAATAPAGATTGAPAAPASAQAAAGAAMTGAADPAAPTAPVGGPAGMSAMARLAESNNSGVMGQATLTQSGSTTTVSVTLSGMAPASAHAGHIHNGTCSGPIIFPLGTITADSAGQGTATATVNAAIDTATWWVQYHASDNPPGPPIACGQPQMGM